MLIQFVLIAWFSTFMIQNTNGLQKGKKQEESKALVSLRVQREVPSTLLDSLGPFWQLLGAILLDETAVDKIYNIPVSFLPTEIKDVHYCTGIIFTEKFIITTLACSKKVARDKIRIYYDNNLVSNVSDIKKDTKYSDVAFLILSQPLVNPVKALMPHQLANDKYLAIQAYTFPKIIGKLYGFDKDSSELVFADLRACGLGNCSSIKAGLDNDYFCIDNKNVQTCPEDSGLSFVINDSNTNQREVYYGMAVFVKDKACASSSDYTLFLKTGSLILFLKGLTTN